jgi:late competence protein required for DNA uptake (superfamily II DNA/RNA helicase)
MQGTTSMIEQQQCHRCHRMVDFDPRGYGDAIWKVIWCASCFMHDRRMLDDMGINYWSPSSIERLGFTTWTNPINLEKLSKFPVVCPQCHQEHP